MSIEAAQIPDAPTNLQNEPDITSSSQIGVSWTAPAFDGGSSLLDYRILYDNASGSTFEVLVSGLTDTSYIATGLT